MEQVVKYPNLPKGQWIFTCAMKPLQFSHIEPRDRKYWNMSDEKWEQFKDDDFVTLEGSSHSKINCSCKPISEAYALWFIKNEIHLIFDKYKDDLDNRWKLYEDEVKSRCLADGIEYEGI